MEPGNLLMSLALQDGSIPPIPYKFVPIADLGEFAGIGRCGCWHLGFVVPKLLRRTCTVLQAPKVRQRTS